ncbi:hypothetical protein A7K94_0220805, partial [Modestobacter sp. VKM Ac-2676]
RPDVDCGTGTVRLVAEAEFRAAAVPLHDALRRWVPGNMARDARWWDRRLLERPEDAKGGPPAPARAARGGRRHGHRLRDVPGARGVERGRRAGGHAHRRDVRASTPSAYAALWRYLFSVDLVRTVEHPHGSADDPLRHLLTDPRAWHSRPVDALWVRLVDVGAALSARRYPPGSTWCSRCAIRSATGTTVAGTCGATRPVRSATAPTATRTWCSTWRRWPRPTWAGSRWPRCRAPAG